MKWNSLIFLVIAACLLGCNDNLDISMAGEPAPKLGLKAPSELNILVIGGTKGVGLETVKLALDRGHKVTAIARNPERMTLSHERLETMKGDILDAEFLDAISLGKDAVVVAVGVGPTRKPVSVFSKGTANVLSAMRKHDILRLSVVTGIGAGDSRGHGGFFYDMILQPLFLKTVYADKDIAEALIRDSGSDWTIVRPGFLVDDVSAANYRVIHDMTDITAGDISRADVAHFIVSGLETSSYLEATVLLSN